MDVLVQLSTDEDSGVRWYVAQNPNTPVDVLVKLSSDEDSYVRWYVAQNPNTQWMC
ncbi:MAG: HEAT repeat domain-containing protein [Cyanobacteria bacterium LVE1205-1]